MHEGQPGVHESTWGLMDGLKWTVGAAKDLAETSSLALKRDSCASLILSQLFKSFSNSRLGCVFR